MTGPSSTPRPEHAPRPGITWNTELVPHGETVIPDDEPTTPPTPNRATRRAAARAARRNK